MLQPGHVHCQSPSSSKSFSVILIVTNEAKCGPNWEESRSFFQEFLTYVLDATRSYFEV